jgi:hypothetical protein
MKMVVFSPSAPWKTQLFLLLLILVIPGFNGRAQYTEVINSNRPGQSVSAYAVGTGVIQLESGFSYGQSGESNDDFDSNLFGVDLGLRYGLLLENLELHYEGTYLNQTISDLDTGVEENLSGFGKNRLGAKYLVFDPFKNPERNKPNLLSWRANNKFQLRNLVPAVSVYAGANFNLGDNPFFPNEPSFSPRALVATQSRLTPRSVLVTNLAYDRIGTDFPELSYLISYSHAFRNPRWSVFLENQGIDSDRYSDMLLRSGLAYLVHEDFQADVSFTYSFNDPGGIFATGGISYRLDYHKDKAIEDQKSRIKRNSMKKKGSDIGISRKEKRQKRKKDRKAAAALDFDN